MNLTCSGFGQCVFTIYSIETDSDLLEVMFAVP